MYYDQTFDFKIQGVQELNVVFEMAILATFFRISGLSLAISQRNMLGIYVFDQKIGYFLFVSVSRATAIK